jgi:site-specific DNA-methyltransferase (adenine-specific)
MTAPAPAPARNNLAPLMSSARHDWRTPPQFYAAVERRLGLTFDLDAAATRDSTLAPRYFGPDHLSNRDALTLNWKTATPWQSAWLNPPYGRGTGQWVEKAYTETQRPPGALVDIADRTTAVLIPARTDTAYWHAHVWRADRVELVKGRLVFLDAATGLPALTWNRKKRIWQISAAPFPVAVVVFRTGWYGPPAVWCWDWKADLLPAELHAMAVAEATARQLAEILPPPPPKGDDAAAVEWAEARAGALARLAA